MWASLPRGMSPIPYTRKLRPHRYRPDIPGGDIPRLWFPMENESYDTTTVTASENAFKTADYELNGRCARFRCASREWFEVDPDSDNDPVGYMSGLTKSNLSAMIAIVRGVNDPNSAYAIKGKHTKEELKDVLETEIRERGVIDEDRSLTVRDSVGPLLNPMLGLLSGIHDIDVSDSLETHRGVISYDHE